MNPFLAFLMMSALIAPSINSMDGNSRVWKPLFFNEQALMAPIRFAHHIDVQTSDTFSVTQPVARSTRREFIKTAAGGGFAYVAVQAGEGFAQTLPGGTRTEMEQLQQWAQEIDARRYNGLTQLIIGTRLTIANLAEWISLLIEKAVMARHQQRQNDFRSLDYLRDLSAGTTSLEKLTEWLFVSALGLATRRWTLQQWAQNPALVKTPSQNPEWIKRLIRHALFNPADTDVVVELLFPVVKKDQPIDIVEDLGKGQIMDWLALERDQATQRKDFKTVKAIDALFLSPKFSLSTLLASASSTFEVVRMNMLEVLLQRPDLAAAADSDYFYASLSGTDYDRSLSLRLKVLNQLNLPMRNRGIRNDALIDRLTRLRGMLKAFNDPALPDLDLLILRHLQDPLERDSLNRTYRFNGGANNDSLAFFDLLLVLPKGILLQMPEAIRFLMRTHHLWLPKGSEKTAYELVKGLGDLNDEPLRKERQEYLSKPVPDPFQVPLALYWDNKTIEGYVLSHLELMTDPIEIKKLAHRIAQSESDFARLLDYYPTAFNQILALVDDPESAADALAILKASEPNRPSQILIYEKILRDDPLGREQRGERLDPSLSHLLKRIDMNDGLFHVLRYSSNPVVRRAALRIICQQQTHQGLGLTNPSMYLQAAIELLNDPAARPMALQLLSQQLKLNPDHELLFIEAWFRIQKPRIVGTNDTLNARTIDQNLLPVKFFWMLLAEGMDEVVLTQAVDRWKTAPLNNSAVPQNVWPRIVGMMDNDSLREPALQLLKTIDPRSPEYARAMEAVIIRQEQAQAAKDAHALPLLSGLIDISERPEGLDWLARVARHGLDYLARRRALFLLSDDKRLSNWVRAQANQTMVRELIALFEKDPDVEETINTLRNALTVAPRIGSNRSTSSNSRNSLAAA